MKKARPETKKTKPPAIARTWLDILPFLLEVAVNGTKKNKAWAELELRRMAKLADCFAGNRDSI